MKELLSHTHVIVDFIWSFYLSMLAVFLVVFVGQPIWRFASIQLFAITMQVATPVLLEMASWNVPAKSRK